MKTKFKQGKIIEKFYVNKGDKNLEVILRYPKKSDLKKVWKFYNKVIKETEFLSRITYVSLKDEKKWLDNILNGSIKGDKVYLLAECDKKIIGSASVERKTEQRRTHVGGFGICILQEFTGIGVGRRMMSVLEKEARGMKLNMLELSVFGKNKIAQDLYKKMEFRVAGKFPKAIKLKKGFDDDVIMYKVLKI